MGCGLIDGRRKSPNGGTPQVKPYTSIPMQYFDMVLYFNQPYHSCANQHCHRLTKNVWNINMME